jgi:ribonucleoside-diphosphate reductase alpha subunit
MTSSTFNGFIESIHHRFRPEFVNFVRINSVKIHEIIHSYPLPFYDWISGATVYNTYLIKKRFDDVDPIERPEYMYMRVAINIHMPNMKKIEECYSDLIKMKYIPASPTIFNSGLKKGQLSSCFIMTVEDSLESILMNVPIMGIISKAKGGIGIDCSRLRNSEIDEVGKSKGILPALKLYDDTVTYVDQGGQRKGVGTANIRAFHIDIYDTISYLDKTKSSHFQRLNICVWAPRFFFDRIRRNEKWTLFCPAKTKELNDLYGEELEKAYIEAENNMSIPKYARKEVRARDLFNHITRMIDKMSQPYIVDFDSVNYKSNQMNIGMIRGTNLCTEIMEVSSKDIIASCNLHSISLKYFVKGDLKEDLCSSYDFRELGITARKVTENLNKVIDISVYPLDPNEEFDYEWAKGVISKPNKKYRPIGIGCSGFADALYLLDIPYECEESFDFNRRVYACIYFNALMESVQQSIYYGRYDAFSGSPFSKGELQFDLWNSYHGNTIPPMDPVLFQAEGGYLYNNEGKTIDFIEPTWESLKRCIKIYGTRNSLLTAQMPTASSATIVRNCENTEAYLTNIYSRDLLKGSYTVINHYLVKDLDNIGCWNNNILNYLIIEEGSMKNIDKYIRKYPEDAPDFNRDYNRLYHLQKKYKGMWEIKQTNYIKMAAERGRYIDQAQSLNIFRKHPTNEEIQSLILYGQESGLKSIIYYLRQSSHSQTTKFSIDPIFTQKVKNITMNNSSELGINRLCTAECLNCN